MVRSQKIFPISVLEQSSADVAFRIPRLRRWLYSLILVVIVISLVSMNYISVDVSVSTQGLVKPREDHTIIVASSGGYVRECGVRQNARVKAGDTLLVIQSGMTASKLPELQRHRDELEALIGDLRLLTTHSGQPQSLRSPLYRQAQRNYLSRLQDAQARLSQNRVALERSKKLYEAKLIPLSEHEKTMAEYTQSQNALTALQESQKDSWQSDLMGYESELRETQTQISQIDIQKSEAVILSPVNGTIQQSVSLFDGSYVSAGMQLAEISPDGALIAECYVLPKDIGYMRRGMEGKVQVSSFNYTEWGMLSAAVEEIFDDVTLPSNDSEPCYKVYCSLNSDHLTLKNGYKGRIKKGMTLRANFTVTSRTLLQLIYDKADDWLNPQKSGLYE